MDEWVKWGFGLAVLGAVAYAVTPATRRRRMSGLGGLSPRAPRANVEEFEEAVETIGRWGEGEAIPASRRKRYLLHFLRQRGVTQRQAASPMFDRKFWAGELYDVVEHEATRRLSPADAKRISRRLDWLTS
jgi:hypothetical protein